MNDSESDFLEEKKSYIQRKIEMEMQALEPAKPLSFKQSLWVVILAHIVIGGFIYGYANKTNAKEDKKFLETKEAQYTGIPEPTPTPTPIPTPAPTPQVVAKVPSTSNDWPKPKPIPSVYFVNSGDTLSSISKRYSVPLKKLQTLNKLKDNSKIQIGQKIKLK